MICCGFCSHRGPLSERKHAALSSAVDAKFAAAAHRALPQRLRRSIFLPAPSQIKDFWEITFFLPKQRGGEFWAIVSFPLPP